MLQRGPLRHKPVEGQDNCKEEPPKAETTTRIDIPKAGQPVKEEPSRLASLFDAPCVAGNYDGRIG